MASQSDPSERAATRAEKRSDDVSTICVVCQQPLDRVNGKRWHGEPVHQRCGAELRCGVAVGATCGERPDAAAPDQ